MSPSRQILVLGAGMVGTCTALHLAMRGHAVTLVDRRTPGQETSYGNAGLIQREAVEPYGFPRSLGKLVDVVLKRGADVNYHLGALPSLAAPLWRYWRNSGPTRYPAIARAYARLIEHATTEHAGLIDAADAGDLVRKQGYLHLFRDPANLERTAQRAQALTLSHSVRHAVLDTAALARAEPALGRPLPGAIHWQDPWSVSDPGELVARYAARLRDLGGIVVQGDASTLRQARTSWAVHTADGPVAAEHAVIALGPWAGDLLRPLGYRLPLFVKRGYHRHYACAVQPRLPWLDADRGLVIAPMKRGLRITTGAEFARLEAPTTARQLAQDEDHARELLELGAAVESEPWRGARPCTADMLPVIGAAPGHRGLWLNFGHAHQGFTLGPISGRLLADLIEGAAPVVDPAPYSVQRFL